MHIAHSQQIQCAQAFCWVHHCVSVYHWWTTPSWSRLHLHWDGYSQILDSSQQIRFQFHSVSMKSDRIRENCSVQLSLWAICVCVCVLINSQKTPGHGQRGTSDSHQCACIFGTHCSKFISWIIASSTLGHRGIIPIQCERSLLTYRLMWLVWISACTSCWLFVDFGISNWFTVIPLRTTCTSSTVCRTMCLELIGD